MTDELREMLLEETASAFRQRDVSARILPSKAWLDLPPEDRAAAFERQLESRIIERALDSEGLSCTVRAVLGRLDW